MTSSGRDRPRDASALLEALRQARRREDDAGVAETTAALLALLDTDALRGEPATLELIAATLVTHGQRAALTRHVLAVLDTHTDDALSEDARHAIGDVLDPIVRTLTQLSEPAAWVQPGALALPSAISLYLRLLRWLRPDDWFDWLARQPQILRVETELGGRWLPDLRTLLTRDPYAPPSLPEYGILVVRPDGRTELRPSDPDAPPPEGGFALGHYSSQTLPALTAQSRVALAPDALDELRTRLLWSLRLGEEAVAPEDVTPPDAGEAGPHFTARPDEPEPLQGIRKVAFAIVCAIFGGLIVEVIAEAWLPLWAAVLVGLIGAALAAWGAWQVPIYEKDGSPHTYYR